MNALVEERTDWSQNRPLIILFLLKCYREKILPKQADVYKTNYQWMCLYSTRFQSCIKQHVKHGCSDSQWQGIGSKPSATHMKSHSVDQSELSLPFIWGNLLPRGTSFPYHKKVNNIKQIFSDRISALSVHKLKPAAFWLLGNHSNSSQMTSCLEAACPAGLCKVQGSWRGRAEWD